MIDATLHELCLLRESGYNIPNASSAVSDDREWLWDTRRFRTGFAWGKSICREGRLYVVSVHLLTSSSARAPRRPTT